ncbi:MAG TPA: ClpXP protease specificity-enhancing factor [Methylophilaceae bacterium]|nr:ClpXP protease specificity-enhancing factor [Methylophilaceae bacterium]
MSELTSTKPYLLRALHEWCADNSLTPHLLVAVDAQTRVPMAYVKDGEIVLNLSYSATKNLLIGNEVITFSARFGGVSNNLYVPIGAVRGLFARENGQGMFFPADETEANVVPGEVAEQNPTMETIEKPSAAKKPFLKLVK